MVDAVLLSALLVLGQTGEVEEVPTPATAVPTETEADTTLVSLFSYQIAQVSRVDVADGRTKVSVETNAPAPRSGSFPVRVFIDNTSGAAQVITLSISANAGGGAHTVTRAVEVRAGERRTVNVPVPAEMHYGTVRATGPGIQSGAAGSMYFQTTYDPQRVVLALSRPEDFERFVGRPPKYSGANVLVHPIAPNEAPTELAAYLGYDVVTVPDGATLDGLDEGQRAALEAYVATGGRLLVGHAVRSPSLFPLITKIEPGANDYGFGQILLAKGHPTADLELFRDRLAVSPNGGVPDYRRRYNPEVESLLLPQATAPLGRFLFIIALFTLAIGPGSVWISRRRGPAVLLVTIPATALTTCALIIGYSLIADGFVVHTSTYGFTLLDSKSHRTITLGVTAYYANLAPSAAHLGPSTMLVAPFDNDHEKYIADLDWKDGLTLKGDFVPSRMYREWGFVSVEPTRARLVIKQQGDHWLLQNALGMPVDRVMVNIDGGFFTAGPLRDGGEVVLERGSTLTYSGIVAASRFTPIVAQVVATSPLREHEFMARIEGPGFVPTGGISAQMHAAQTWIRGEYEE